MKQERLEDPVETFLDVVTRDLGVIVYSQYDKDLLSRGPYPELEKKIEHPSSNSYYVYGGWNKYAPRISKDIGAAGTHVSVLGDAGIEERILIKSVRPSFNSFNL